MIMTTEQRLTDLFDKMLAEAQIHGDVEDLLMACSKIALTEMDKVWDLAVEETACWARPDKELEGFVIIDNSAIYKTKAELGLEYITYE